MNIWELNKLVIFIAFVIPGFISLKTYDLLLPGNAKDSAKQLIDAVAYSSINYAIFLWPIYELEIYNVRDKYPTAYIFFYACVLLIAPIAWALLLKKLRTTQFLQGTLPHPTTKPWDYIFSQRNSYWVIVTLKNGQQIAGLYGLKSFASSAPAPEQIYLEEAWVLNDQGGFDRAKRESAGIIILSSEIIAVELFNVTFGENNDQEPTNE